MSEIGGSVPFPSAKRPNSIIRAGSYCVEDDLVYLHLRADRSISIAEM
jgi:hypothetical protein